MNEIIRNPIELKEGSMYTDVNGDTRVVNAGDTVFPSRIDGYSIIHWLVNQLDYDDVKHLINTYNED